MDTGHMEQDLLLQREQPTTPKSPRVVSPPSSSRGSAILSLAATAAPAPTANKLGYCSGNGYLMELSIQERRRVEQEIKKRFKPGETWHGSSINALIYKVPLYFVKILITAPKKKSSESCLALPLELLKAALSSLTVLCTIISIQCQVALTLECAL